MPTKLDGSIAPTTSADISHTASSDDPLLGKFVGEHGAQFHISFNISGMASTLRVDYLTDHFVHQSDNEPLGEEDSHIASLACRAALGLQARQCVSLPRLRVRCQTDVQNEALGVRRLSDGAIANLFSLKINTFTLNRSGTNVVTVKVNIGFIMQYHWFRCTSSLACATIRRDSEVPQPMVVDGNQCTNVHFGTNSNDPVAVCVRRIGATTWW